MIRFYGVIYEELYVNSYLMINFKLKYNKNEYCYSLNTIKIFTIEPNEK